MTSSIDKVSKNAKNTSEITTKTVEQALAASSCVAELGRAAEKINTVINTINGISDQTNFFALNTTIQAPGAGEAGRGFAVIATEIKELAMQMAGAGYIQEIQNLIFRIYSGNIINRYFLV